MSKRRNAALPAFARRRLLLGAGALGALPLLPTVATAQRRPAPAAPAARRPAAQAPAGPQPTSVMTPFGSVDVLARSALLIDFDTEVTLIDKGADELMPPASMSKLMTVYVVFERLKEGRMRLTDELPVSERAWRMGGSKMFVEVGTRVKVEDLLRGVIVQSGNDACVVLAEAISGSEENFAEELTRRGRAIGLTHSTFRNSTGWPDPSHRMTPRDLARLATRLIRDFPEQYRYYSERNFRYGNITQENRNPLLGRFPGADGLKTGHTEESGYGLTASAVQNGRRLILVVNGLPSMRARGEETARLLNWGFANTENVTVFRAADTVEEAPVWLGDRATVPLITGRDLIVTMPRTWRSSAQVVVRYNGPIAAPVTRGTEVGEVAVGVPGLPTRRAPLLAGADVRSLGFFPRIGAALRHYVLGGA